MATLTNTSRNRRLLVAGALIAVLCGIAALMLNAQSTDVIYACVGNKNGAVKIVTDATECGKSEHLLTWGQQGPAGPPGPTGPAGATGGFDLVADDGTVQGTVLGTYLGMYTDPYDPSPTPEYAYHLWWSDSHQAVRRVGMYPSVGSVLYYSGPDCTGRRFIVRPQGIVSNELMRGPAKDGQFTYRSSPRELRLVRLRVVEIRVGRLGV